MGKTVLSWEKDRSGMRCSREGDGAGLGFVRERDGVGSRLLWGERWAMAVGEGGIIIHIRNGRVFCKLVCLICIEKHLLRIGSVLRY